jgi:hypothetical protein
MKTLAVITIGEDEAGPLAHVRIEDGAEEMRALITLKTTDGHRFNWEIIVPKKEAKNDVLGVG